MDRSIEELFEKKKVKKISSVTSKVFKIIHEKWPVNPLEVAAAMGDNGSAKSLSAKYIYHFRKLRRADLIKMKKVGNTYVAWPAEIERLRIIHELLGG